MRWIGDASVNSAERLAAVNLYLALMTEACLGLIGAKGPIFVEGPFALNRAYLAALSALTNTDVVALAGSTGTSQGAALLTGIRPATTAENVPVRAELPGLIHYRRAWREALDG
jgi:sugar (pentulose or hexulose) kinase